MSTAALIPSPKQQFLDADGNPLSGGKLYTYAAGTTTPLATWSDSGLSIANANPVVLDSAGRAAIYLSPVAYKIVLKTSADVTVWTQDSVTDIGALLRSQLADSAYGSTLVAFRHSGTGAVTRNVQDRLRDTLNVLDFGAVGDGVTDDTAAIQAAVTSLVATGGVVYFPTNRGQQYVIKDTVTISSTKPIHLRSDAFGCVFNPTGSVGVVLGATISGPMFRYTAPDSGQRAASGGGSVQGMAFIDLLDRNYTCTAVLDLHDFLLSTVRNCSFQYIKGSAILGEFMVMSEISGNTIRYCGNTGFPAIDLPSTSAVYPAQSLQIFGNRIEVHHLADYVQIGINTRDVGLIDNRFEAATTETPDSNQIFVHVLNGAERIRIIGNQFNRNTATQVSVAARTNVIQGNIFTGGAYTTTALVVSGGSNVINGNVFLSGRLGLEVLLSGPWNSFSGNTLYSAGSIKATGYGNVISNNTLSQLTATTANLGAGEDFWINVTVDAITCVVSGNVLDNNGGGVTTVGGIKIAGTVSAGTGNVCRAFGGTGSGAKGILLAGNLLTVTGNGMYGSLLSPDGFYDSAIGNNTTTDATTLPLYSESSHTPGSIAAGATVTFTLTITGTVVGDIAIANQSADQGLAVSTLTSTNTVYVTLHNIAAIPVDPGTFTLYVRVLKKWN